MNPSAREAWATASHSFSTGRLDEARAALESLLRLDQRDPAAWVALTHVAMRMGEVRNVTAHALAAARYASDPAMLCDIAGSLETTGAMHAARACVERAASANPAAPAIRQSIAMHFQNLGEHGTALEWMERAKAAGLDTPEGRFCHAIQLTFHGRVQEAEAELESCIDVTPPFGRAMAQLAQLRRQTPERNHLQVLERQLAAVAQGGENHAALEFARYKECDDLGKYQDAWRSLKHGNDLMHALRRHDSDAEQRTGDALLAQVPGILARAAVPANAGPTPIFIVGLPRSGTTLLDRLLGNHSEVHSAGELGTFRRCLERVVDRFTGPMLDEPFVGQLAPLDCAELGELYLANSQWCAGDHRFYVDKMPRNWLLAPLIHAAIPKARIVHIVRDPMDVAFSSYRSYFGSDYAYGYDIATLIRHYRMYRRLMQSWHAAMPGAMLDVSYRELTRNTEAELRRVLAFCGLSWQAGCADLSRNQSPVATPSAVQVRGTISTEMSMRWCNYASQLESLRTALAAVTDGA